MFINLLFDYTSQQKIQDLTMIKFFGVAQTNSVVG